MPWEHIGADIGERVRMVRSKLEKGLGLRQYGDGGLTEIVGTIAFAGVE
jgi:hypothetical protein